MAAEITFAWTAGGLAWRWGAAVCPPLWYRAWDRRPCAEPSASMSPLPVSRHQSIGCRWPDWGGCRPVTPTCESPLSNLPGGDRRHGSAESTEGRQPRFP